MFGTAYLTMLSCLVQITHLNLNLINLATPTFTDVERSEKKSRSYDLRDTHLTYCCIFWFVGLAVNRHTKFEVTNFTHSRYIECIP